MSCAFTGTWALIVAKRRNIIWLPLLCGLLPALFFGLMFGLAGYDSNDLYGGCCVALGLACLFFPLAASWDTTFAGTGGQLSTSRREEFLALSMGRLAIPTAITAVGAATVVAFTIVGLLGLSLTVGGGNVVHALFLEPARPMALWLGAAGVFLYFNALSCMGTASSLSMLLAPFAFLGVSICVLGMGHPEATFKVFLFGNLTVFAVYYLLLPFMLYARKRHHWEMHKKGVTQDSFDQTVYLTTLAAAVVFAVAGAGLTLAAVVLLGGTLAYKTRLERRERHRVPSLRLAYGLMFLMLAPGAIYAWTVDQRELAAVAPGNAVQVIKVVVSPDERYAAVQFCAASRATEEQAIRRVALVDLAGGPTKLLEPRFATIAGWSKDGRYLAVQDESVGRIRTGIPEIHFRSHLDALRTSAAARFFRTLIVDTKTGDVESLDLRAVAPGWRTPADLVTIRATWKGHYLVTDQAGADLVVKRAGWLNVLRYEEGRPLLRTPLKAALWTGTELIDKPDAVPAADKPDEWVIDGWTASFAKPADPRSQLTLTRGADTVTLPKVGDVVSTGSGDAILVVDAAGFKRVSLPSGEEQVIVASVKTSPVLEVRGSFETTIWIQSVGGWHIYDPATSSVSPVEVGSIVNPRTFLADGRLIGERDGDFWIRTVDGTLSRLLPRRGE